MASMFSRLPYQASPARRHHGAGLSQFLPFALPSLGSLLYWKLSALWRQQPDHRPEMIPVCCGDAAALRANRQRASVTWLGHASSFIQLAGLNILIDPVLSPRVSPFAIWGQSGRCLPLDLPDLPRIDLVLLTHLHYDHLDFPPCSGWRRSRAGRRRCCAAGCVACSPGGGHSRRTSLSWTGGSSIGMGRCRYC
jgi:hypothetical protein